MMDTGFSDAHIYDVPVISKPANRGPLFSGRTTIMLLPNRGSDLIPIYRRYRERLARGEDREGAGPIKDENADR